jgi:hypothetical protein
MHPYIHTFKQLGLDGPVARVDLHPVVARAAVANEEGVLLLLGPLAACVV